MNVKGALTVPPKTFTDKTKNDSLANQRRLRQAEGDAPQLPQDPTAEAAVIGGSMMDPAALVTARTILTADDFANPANIHIFSAMEALADAGTDVTLVTVVDQLRQESELEAAGGVEYVSSLYESRWMPSGVASAAAIVRKKKGYRDLIHFYQIAQQRAFEQQYHPAQLASDGAEILLDLEKSGNGRDWKGTFHQIDELAEGKSKAIIEGYIEEGVSWLGAKSGVGKSWLGLSEGKALRTGEKFLDTFTVPEKYPVLYYIPEMTERRFRSRCELLGIDIHDPEFLVRTMNDGAPLPLNDPRVRACVKELQPVVFLDTAVRFNTGKDENSAGDVSQGLVAAIYQLVELGARAVRCLHHRAKESSDDELSLENVLRGSGDFGASAVCVWGAAHETAERAGRLQQLDTLGRGRDREKAEASRLSREYLEESKRLGRCFVKCVKPGDNEILLSNFRIQLRPSIDDFGKIEMLTALPLPEPDPGPRLDAYLATHPDSTGDALAKEIGIHRTTAIRRAKNRGWSFDESAKRWHR